LLFLILEASGVRPSSAHGLTLGDLHLYGIDRDFLHIHRTGGYGEAKSEASIGFVPLQGHQWEASRGWVRGWLERQASSLDGTHWWKTPVFATAPGGHRRFNRRYLTGRFDELLKWASGEAKARTYWLRKNRVMAKHRQASSQTQPRARDSYAAMRSSGHTHITVPITSYISDPAIVMSHHVRQGRFAARKAILGVTGLADAPLDAAWLRRGGADAPNRLAVVLDRMDVQPAIAPSEHLTPPPPLRRHQKLMPRHIDSFARAMHKFEDRAEAMLRSGLSDVQADILDRFAAEMVVRRGSVPWRPPGLKHPRSVLRPPRRFEGTGALNDALDGPPDQPLCLLADVWVRSGHLQRLHGSDVLVDLVKPEELSAAIDVLKKMPLHLRIEERDGRRVICIHDRGDRRKSHAAAFRWTMAIMWLYMQMLSERPDD